MTEKDLATRLGAVAARSSCPVCDHSELEFVLRCDLAYGSCLYTARCGGCNLSFEIVVSEDELDVEALREEIGPCPCCGGMERTATLQCSEKTMACAYRLDCATCMGRTADSGERS